MMVIAVAITSIFSYGGANDHLQIDLENRGLNMTLTIIGGLGAAFFFGTQLLIFKHLVMKLKDGFLIAYTFLAIASFYGIGGVIYTFIQEP